MLSASDIFFSLLFFKNRLQNIYNTIILLIMGNVSSKEFFFIGLSLSNTPNNDSSVCVIDRMRNIVLLDKLYFTSDIELFFEKNPYVKNSQIIVSIPHDNTLLEGKWRIHCKNYKMMDENFKVNRNNWTNRLSDRCSDVLLKLKENGTKVSRFDVNLLRQGYGLSSNYLQRTSLDCKSLQSALKIKFGFDELPENMLPASSLEAILGAMFLYDCAAGDTSAKKLFEYEGLEVLNKA